jgi:hypothetical protein
VRVDKKELSKDFAPSNSRKKILQCAKIRENSTRIVLTTKLRKSRYCTLYSIKKDNFLFYIIYNTLNMSYI